MICNGLLADYDSAPKWLRYWYDHAGFCFYVILFPRSFVEFFLSQVDFVCLDMSAMRILKKIPITKVITLLERAFLDWPYRVQKRWHHKKNFFFFAFQRFGYHVSVEHDEKHPQPKFGGNRFMGPEIWPHEYLIGPIEISLNWPGSKQLCMNQANLYWFQ